MHIAHDMIRYDTKLNDTLHTKNTFFKVNANDEQMADQVRKMTKTTTTRYKTKAKCERKKMC